MKNIIILGSTGSIGVSALKVIKQHPEKYRVAALSAARNIGLLLRQIKEFKPVAVSVLDESLAERLKTKLGKGPAPDIFFGKNGYKQIATMEGTDTVISAMTGAAGLIPTFEAIQSGKNIALANKETMVMAGGLVMDEAKKRGVSILPVDSEHSAILQSLQGHPREDLKRIILTASGGPFRNLSLDEMRKMTAAQALNHPNWDMGPKITIDSATLMNKGLEIIEAKWLFDLPLEKIGVLVHPQSIIHSMAEYIDGSIIAQLGVPDMTIPISYALSYPHHLRNHLSPLDLLTAGDLQFQKPDLSRFRCLALALEAAKTGGTMPAVLNGSNEIAVDAFLKGQIGFLDIPALIEKTMRTHNVSPVDSIAAVVEADGWARRETREHLENLIGPLHG
ncbi:MAG TPA: 1-deoxy-D-xylulose-5-phosphate reductoisomerase [Deltaproteobacteria bacterium]|nr:1-deoxy-D-xylulose-5-phosphate reductoisomerase [Deltaproteobacteria bacterium]HIJ39515.1 1-deoxy-D-xylulose-5-phosphate reductoisomerase [Deltaproteobacteria bacterium]